MTSKAKHPMPWRTVNGASFSYVVSADGDTVGATGATRQDRATAKRIVRAVNAFKSPLARTERVVVKAAIRKRTVWGAGIEDVEPDLLRAVDRLPAERAKAKKAKR